MIHKNKEDLFMEWKKQAAVLMLTAGMAAACLTACGGKTDSEVPDASETSVQESTLEAAAETDSTKEAPLPKEGDVIHGFIVDKVTHNDTVDSDLITLTHQKTGAQVIYVANEDINRAFDIMFQAPASDTGVSHVFEHATVTGSEKYPVDIWFPLTSQTANTYINANTRFRNTDYQAASISDEQLLKLADYFLDAVFHPLVVSDKSRFDTEAWRYELASPEDELTITGTVYSEMKGTIPNTERAYYNILKTMFPGSNRAAIFGGDPEVIPELTFEKMADYHEEYYRPSNSLTYLYGKIDYEKYLELLDSSFKNYDDGKADTSDDDYTPISGYVEKEYKISESGDPTIIYAIPCPTDSEEDLFGLIAIGNLMNWDSTAFQQKMQEQLPEVNAGVELDYQSTEPFLMFSAENIDPEQKDLFKQIVEESIRETIENGFDVETLEEYAAAEERSILTMKDNDADIGIDDAENMSVFWTLTGDPESYYRYLDYMADLKEKTADGQLEKLLETYIANADRSALTVNIPDEAYAKEKEEALAKKLAAVKEAMTQEEIAEIVARTNETEEADPNINEYIKSVNVSNADTLREELDNYQPKEYPYTDETTDHVRHLIAVSDNDRVSKAAIYFDVSAFDEEQLQYLSLYSNLMDELPTVDHSAAEISGMLARYADMGFQFIAEDDLVYYLCEMTMLDEDVENAYEALHERLFESDFGDAEDLKTLVQRQEKELEASIRDTPTIFMSKRARAKADKDYAMLESVCGLTYYEFLKQVEAELEKDPQQVVSRLEEAVTLLENKQNASSVFVGDEETIRRYQAASKKFFELIPYEERTAAKHVYTVPEANEAFIIDSSVNYNMIYADMDLAGTTADGALFVTQNIVYDKILIPQLRYNKGAYGVAIGLDENEILITSIYDPQLKDTYDTYANIGEELSNLELTEEELEGYIVSTFVGAAVRRTDMTDRYHFLTQMICDTDQVRNSYECLTEILDTTVEKVKAYVSVYDVLGNDGGKITMGKKSDILANADLFDSIEDLFGD
jgi:hypothetical protein